MDLTPNNLSTTFKDFFDSEKSGRVVLIVCTVISLVVTNSMFGSPVPHNSCS